MPRAPQVTDDIAVQLREYERRLNVLEGRQGLRPEGMGSGIVPGGFFGATSNDAASADLDDTDMQLADVVFDVSRRYAVNIHSQAIRLGTATASWHITMTVDGIVSYRLFTESALADNELFWVTARMPWDPTGVEPEDTTVTHDIGIQVDRVSGDGTLTFQASATVPRFFWVEDIGLRVYPAAESEDDLP